ncbi:MAG: glycosyltransferase family 2 protein [Lachnospiraceae bacterium]|nr:glycosyltransferase family 2 protein [Lachnospiraceae bacterium]
MEIISIIVPIFRGRKYIEGMIAQVERCAEKCKDRHSLELILVNDDPGETIESFYSEKIEIKVLKTDVNRGIHGTRVRGLEHCASSYVLFLDQDDRIVPEYFVSQLAHLGDGDAVVCKLLHEGRQFYDTRMPFEEVITREFILSVRNPIISPGQVLIKKEKIPEVWKTTRLKNNGADDWMLWLCMLAEDCKFNLNPTILFEHVVEGGNESINTAHMIASEREIYETLVKYQAFSQEDLEKLKRTVQAAEKEHIRLLSKFQKMFFVYDQWLRLQEEGKHIHNLLKRYGIRRVAIYGDSYIGKRLYHSLRKNGVEISCFIDRNAAYLEEEIPVYPPKRGLPAVDLIIISLVEAIEAIREELTQLSEAEICSLTELFADMENARDVDAD